MQLEGTGLSWECARRTCAAWRDKLAGLRLSTSHRPFCPILLAGLVLTTLTFSEQEELLLHLWMRKGYLRALLETDL